MAKSIVLSNPNDGSLNFRQMKHKIMNNQLKNTLGLFAMVCVSTFFLASCGDGKKDATSDQSEISTTEFLKGKKIYEARCANCHKNDGAGMGTLYPPIAGSDYLINNVEKVICGIKYGQNEPIVVNGKNYKMQMPAHPDLNEVEISDIMNYILNSWGNNAGPISLEKVESALANCQ